MPRPNTFIGIDPGITGAVAVLRDDGSIEFSDTPSMVIIGGKKQKRVYNGPAMTAILRDLFPSELKLSELAAYAAENMFCAIERVQAFPAFSNGGAVCRACGRGPSSQGVVSMFGFGEGFGRWQGILDTLQIPYDKVSPVSWKKTMMPDQGKEKDASRQVAMRRFPGAVPSLTLMKHHGRADALLIADFGRRTWFEN